MVLEEFSGFVKNIIDDIIVDDRSNESFDIIHENWKKFHDERLLLDMDKVVLEGKEPECFEIAEQIHEIGGVLMHFFILRLIYRYSWAIPSNEAIQTIVKYSPIVEMGAGTGYWAKLVRDAGGTIVPFDIDPPRTGANTQTSKREWVEIQRGTPELLSHYDDHALLLCWIPNDEPMGEDCLEHFRGKHVIYIGEPKMGCNGTHHFHYILNRDFIKVEEVRIPVWHGHHDRLYVYERREIR